MGYNFFYGRFFDGKHVDFGNVVSGLKDVKKIEKFGSKSGKPSEKITITGCGELVKYPPQIQT